MARIKGEWVGEISIKVDFDEADTSLSLAKMKKRFTKDYAVIIKRIIEERVDSDFTVTVKQIKAELRRDEPNEAHDGDSLSQEGA